LVLNGGHEKNLKLAIVAPISSFSVGVIVRFRFMAGVIMIVGAVICLVFMLMIDWAAAMFMLVIVLMGMIVAMVMDVFVTVFYVPMRMLMNVLMHVVVVMQMIVFVFSFHHQNPPLQPVVVFFQIFPYGAF
jgi:hypothetical protein